MPRQNNRKLQPIAAYPTDRVYVRTEAARRDVIPADIIAEAVRAYRKTKTKGAEPVAEGKAVAVPGKGAA